MLVQFLDLFGDCFRGIAGRKLLLAYVRGLLSDVQRKNVEAIALSQKIPPRTLQRFLESIKWDEQRLRDRCQQLIATEHQDDDAIGLIDETGTTKSGNHTAGVKRQYNGNRGKSKTASTMSRSPTPAKTFIVCWTLVCIFLGSGLTIRNVEKKLHSRRR